MKKKTGLGILCVAVLLLAGFIGFRYYWENKPMSNQNDGSIRVDDYQKDTKERFVASLAVKNKMSSEQVEAL